MSGKTLERHQKRWTAKEEDKLRRLLGEEDMWSISKKMGRTKSGVERKVEKMHGVSSKTSQGYLTAHLLANLMRVDTHTVLLWLNKYGLPHTRRVVHATREFIQIDPVLFWKWAYQHKQLINFAKVPLDAVFPEPRWVQEARKEDRLAIARRKQQYWTPVEDAQLLSLRSKGMTQAETGEKLGRSRRAVQKREHVLREQGKCTKTTL